MSKRLEFSKQTKREALERSGFKCEAVGTMYGLSENQRCYVPLSDGVQFDHILAASNGGGIGLENCASVCIRCHGFKTAKIDTPRAAQIKRQSDKAKGIVRPSSPLSGNRQPKPPMTKTPLPPRAMFISETVH